jgi:hypothetical protein
VHFSAQLELLQPKRKHTKRLLAKIYYSPQSKVSIFLRLVQNACRNWAIVLGVTPRGSKYVWPRTLKRFRSTKLLHFWKTIVQLCTTFIIYVLALCKAARPAPPKKRKSKFWCCNKALRLLSLWLQHIKIFKWSYLRLLTIKTNIKGTVSFDCFGLMQKQILSFIIITFYRIVLQLGAAFDPFLQ